MFFLGKPVEDTVEQDFFFLCFVESIGGGGRGELGTGNADRQCELGF